MIIIPEIKTVVLLVARTGSTTLRRAILEKYPKAMTPYRHMEADGIPHGYDRWRKVGVLRHPVERLWSLYLHLQTIEQQPNWVPGYADRMRESLRGRDFSAWITDNEAVFSDPYSRNGGLEFFPAYTVLHPRPETRKSQFLTLRPDLGTEIWPFARLSALAEDLGVGPLLRRENASGGGAIPVLTLAATDHVNRWFAWDRAVHSALDPYGSGLGKSDLREVYRDAYTRSYQPGDHATAHDAGLLAVSLLSSMGPSR